MSNTRTKDGVIYTAVPLDFVDETREDVLHVHLGLGPTNEHPKDTVGYYFLAGSLLGTILDVTGKVLLGVMEAEESHTLMFGVVALWSVVACITVNIFFSIWYMESLEKELEKDGGGASSSNPNNKDSTTREKKSSYLCGFFAFSSLSAMACMVAMETNSTAVTLGVTLTAFGSILSMEQQAGDEEERLVKEPADLDCKV